jgi:hypothetical protein
MPNTARRADVTGWYSPDNLDDHFQGIRPTRIVDTRAGNGGPTLQAGEVRTVVVPPSVVPRPGSDLAEVHSRARPSDDGGRYALGRTALASTGLMSSSSFFLSLLVRV